jgi:hypothetical protein
LPLFAALFFVHFPAVTLLSRANQFFSLFHEFAVRRERCISRVNLPSSCIVIGTSPWLLAAALVSRSVVVACISRLHLSSRVHTGVISFLDSISFSHAISICSCSSSTCRARGIPLWCLDRVLIRPLPAFVAFSLLLHNAHAPSPRM